jgi:Spy/CpxP family protein refolding chaperone
MVTMKPLGPKVQAVVLLLLVATSGALAGIVGDRLLTDRQDPAGAPADTLTAPPFGGPWRWEARPQVRYAERLGDVLELTPAQRTAIDSIVAEEQARVRALTEQVQPRFREIARDARDRIEELLTAAQRETLRSLREERMRTLRRGDPRWRQDSMRNPPGDGRRRTQ